MRIKQTMKCLLVLIGLLSLGTMTAQAAGFAMYETSARGNAMGGAIVGLTDDASAVYNNPANMVGLPGVQTMLGATVIMPTSKQDLGASGAYRLDDQVFVPPHAYVTWKLDDNWWFGFGEYTRFGLGTQFDPNWPGRCNNISAKIETISLNPNLAYKISDQLSVAAGLEIMYMDIKLQKSLSPLVFFPLTLEGSSWGVGGDFALSWKPCQNVGVGLVYRLPVRQQIVGTADTPSQHLNAEGTIVLPASWTLGVNYKPTDRLNLGFATTYTEWSSYNQLDINFNPALNGVLPLSHTEKNWHDVFRFGFGAEYKLSESWAVQGSYVYDMDPISYAHADYMLPPGNRHIIGLGLGYTVDTWTINGGYSLLLMDPVSFGPAAGGIYATKSKESLAGMLGLSVGKKF